MECKIEYYQSPTDTWQKLYAQVEQMNLLQSLAYSAAMMRCDHYRVRYGLIFIDGVHVGIFQVFEKNALRGILQAVIIDRAPLWMEGFGNEAHMVAFIDTLRCDYPRRFGRAMRFMPECEASAQINTIMQRHQFHRRSNGYQTLMLDLTQSDELLRGNLRKNWRNDLSKAERLGVAVEWYNDLEHLDWVLEGFVTDQKMKGYSAGRVSFLNTLCRQFAVHDDLLIGRAMFENEAVGAMLILCHGRTATYQIGWSTQKGREVRAQNMLLWQAALCLKARDITQFDLGGVNDQDAKDVQYFKDGMGGKSLALAGLYT